MRSTRNAEMRIHSTSDSLDKSVLALKMAFGLLNNGVSKIGKWRIPGILSSSLRTSAIAVNER